MLIIRRNYWSMLKQCLKMQPKLPLRLVHKPDSEQIQILSASSKILIAYPDKIFMIESSTEQCSLPVLILLFAFQLLEFKHIRNHTEYHQHNTYKSSPADRKFSKNHPRQQRRLYQTIAIQNDKNGTTHLSIIPMLNIYH